MERSRVWRAAPGYAMPDFILPDGTGRHVHRAQYRGHNSLVVVFVGDGLGETARGFLSSLVRWYPKYAMGGAEVLAILLGPPAAARELEVGQELPFPVLADEDGRLYRECAALDARGQPRLMVFLVDVMGQIEAVYRKDGAGLPTPNELHQWLAFLGAQCAA